VNLWVSRNQQGASPDPRFAGFFVDTLDLYSARLRGAFIHQAADALGVKESVLQRDLGHLMLRLEQLQEKLIETALEPDEAPASMTETEKREALEFLKDPNLTQRILDDFTTCGVVGEEANKLVAYLGAVSRLLDEPLALLIQSTSAAGKTTLLEGVLRFVPEQERVAFSAMTGQSLFYMGETELQHKVLAVAEEEGADRAAYALKLLQSEGTLSIASTGKDPATGKLVSREYVVEGPVALILTTTALDVEEDLQNRCIVLTVDEDRELTRAIHGVQREQETLAGLMQQHERTQITLRHQNAQRLLRRLAVVNPYAPQLTFLDHTTRMRRDHKKYLGLIRAIAFLHQYQREVKHYRQGGEEVEYVEVTKADIALANDLAHEVFGRSLDHVPPQTRRLLVLLDEMVTERAEAHAMDRSDVRFSRRDVRSYSRWSDSRLKIHMRRLQDLEYVVLHRGGRGLVHEYEILWERRTESGKPSLPGILDADQLVEPTSTMEVVRDQSGGGQAQVRGVSG
jgi:hypothetical protein